MLQSDDFENDARPASTWMNPSLTIRGVAYDNSAARFWPAFLAELCRRYPRADRFVLEAPGNGPLHPGLLTPALAISDAIKRLDEDFDFQAAMQGIAAEIEAAGPPPNVVVTALAGEEVLKAGELTDLPDAEVFPFLLVWLLEWSCLNEAAWNRACLRGAFTADDPGLGLRYIIRFELQNRYLNEGLFQRSLALRWLVDPVREESENP